MNDLCLEALRGALEGVIPAVLATVDGDGTPNVSMISQVHYVERQQVALSYQFFNKTRRNLMVNRLASVLVTDGTTLAMHRLQLEYRETLTSGPLFETMKAKLAGIASHSGLEGVFRLLGSDLFRVLSIETVSEPVLHPPPNNRSLLSAAQQTCTELAVMSDLDELLDRALHCLDRNFGIAYSMVLMVESHARRLYTVASHGYETSGIGSEVAFGEGVIGVAARENTPIRIGHMTTEYRYGATLMDSARRAGIIAITPVEIPFPGLHAPKSQIAVPISLGGQILGILFAESEEIMAFCYEEEDALRIVASHLAVLLTLLREDEEAVGEPLVQESLPSADTVTIRYHRLDQSIFLDHDYLIKGVAGAILWRLVSEHVQTGRTEFSNRELRLDPSLRLPAHAENLDARLILLRKRLDERDACIRLEKSGRGRFRLLARSQLELEEMGETGQPLAV
ncbi:GAF domain-containing protein [Oricola cellulosilytica]|uniref:GAF domain-containing protein n=1 Tax=Oricola cellulosilytica TaxID=1429082 RepID=A0A4R0PEB6_9HYPH|nr:GAF domain-containing protein [Oricola cellulosilytica]TCD16136.1 GAF domain-containing protein [Oricola cellulosilytica]